jgi:hypothetical protein
MKKIFLVLAMVFILAGVAIPCEVPAQTATATATATGGSVGAITNINNPAAIGNGGAGGAGGAGGSAVIQSGAVKNDIKNTNTNLNVNTNVFDPKNTNIQGQFQGQKQSVNNGQNISPVQETNISTPQNLLGTPSQYVPQLNFGNGRMKDATGELPRFAIYGITALATEPIMEVLSCNANIKFKNLYKTVLEDAKTVAGNGSKTLNNVRYQIIRSEAQKSWSTGGNIGGGGSALASSGLGGVSAAGSIIPQFGGTKADDLFTVIFVKVAL